MIYLNTVANYKIWKLNLKIQHENFEFNHKKYFQSRIRTIEGRRKMQDIDYMKHSKKVSDIDALASAVKQVYGRMIGIR